MARILLVDDDADVVRRNTAALEAAGHVVRTASTTVQGLEAIHHKVPDLVVIEALVDGGLTGFDLVRSLARDFPALPIIVLSRVDEYLTPAERAAQDRDGGWLPVQRFLEKPVAPDVLVYEIEHLLAADAVPAGHA